jgi:hypothetical protein
VTSNVNVVKGIITESVKKEREEVNRTKKKIVWARHRGKRIKRFSNSI